MAEQILFPEWRKQNSTTKYPFSARASLTNLEGRVFVAGLFLDAALYPIGATSGLYLSSVVIDHENITVFVGDAVDGARASGTIPLINPPDDLVLEDIYGRPAGILVSESQRLSQFQSWGVGTHEFLPADTEFAVTVCFPTPEVGVRGIQLESGELFIGDVWLVGDDGVVLRAESAVVPLACGEGAHTNQAIRVDIVGDPLFRRRLCQPASLFNTPRFVRQIRIIGPNMDFVCEPDEHGNIPITSNNRLVGDTVLRIVTTATGIRIGAVGQATGKAG